MEGPKRFRIAFVLAVLASTLLTSNAQLDIVGAIDAVQSAKGLPPLTAQQAAAIQAACQAASDVSYVSPPSKLIQATELTYISCYSECTPASSLLLRTWLVSRGQ